MLFGCILSHNTISFLWRKKKLLLHFFFVVQYRDTKRFLKRKIFMGNLFLCLFILHSILHQDDFLLLLRKSLCVRHRRAAFITLCSFFFLFQLFSFSLSVASIFAVSQLYAQRRKYICIIHMPKFTFVILFHYSYIIEWKLFEQTVITTERNKKKLWSLGKQLDLHFLIARDIYAVFVLHYIVSK